MDLQRSRAGPIRPKRNWATRRGPAPGRRSPPARIAANRTPQRPTGLAASPRRSSVGRTDGRLQGQGMSLAKPRVPAKASADAHEAEAGSVHPEGATAGQKVHAAVGTGWALADAGEALSGQHLGDERGQVVPDKSPV